MKEYNKLGKYKAYEIDITDKEYPEALKKINNPPKTLYVYGNLPDPNKKSVAIVGARAASEYGCNVSKTISSYLSNNDVQIISGLAIGCDSNAHVGSLNVGKPTFAVLGCGVDICYPSYNQSLYDEILNTGGGIISEHSFGTPPLPSNFPLRNRIITGLSDIVCIVEAKKKSGTMIYADYSLDQDKTLFAVPSNIGNSLGEGCNYLIKQGAYIMTHPKEILEHLGLYKELEEKPFNLENLTYLEKIVYDSLKDESLHIDDIMNNTTLPKEKIEETLLSLKIYGLVESKLSNYYNKTDIEAELNKYSIHNYPEIEKIVEKYKIDSESVEYIRNVNKEYSKGR